MNRSNRWYMYGSLVLVMAVIMMNLVAAQQPSQSQPQAQPALSATSTSSSNTSASTTTTPAAGGGAGGTGGGGHTGAPVGAGGNATKGAMSSNGSPDNSILQQIGSFDKLSMVKLAMMKGELKSIADLLDNKNNSVKYTLFAPSNDALNSLIQAANSSSANQTFSEEDKEGLMVAGIYYHIVPKQLLTSDMKQLLLPKTLLNDSKFVNLPDNKPQRLHIMTEQVGNEKKVQIWFGLDKDAQAKKSNIILADIQCANGVIHIIDKVVEVPLSPSHILKEGGLTRFLEALKKDGLDKKLDDTKGLTVFAPVNTAFDVPKGDDKDMNASLAKLLQEGLFYVHANSSGVIKFKKLGDVEDDETKKANASSGAATATGGVRKLLQAIANATTGGATGVTATKVNDTTWQLSGSFKNWKVDGVSILVHDVITKNGVMHVIDKIVGLPKAGGAGAKSNASVACSDIKCPSGDECCEVSIDSPENSMPRCFSPTTHVCASRGSFLCGKDTPHVCGLHCYSKSQYTCINSLLLCPTTAPNACGVACFSAKDFKCVNGNLQLLGSEDKKQQCP